MIDIKAKACELGVDLVGIGDIRHFAGTSMERNPLSILPNAKCIIGLGFRVPRALVQAMAEQRQFFNYTQLGVKYIDEELAEITLLKLGAQIENMGYDACLQRNVSNLRIKGDHSTNPELVDTYELVYAEPVAPGKATPDVILDFNQAAFICGLGAAGRSGKLLTPKFGPFIRTAFIITDAPFKCDAPFSGTLCDDCAECEAACPGRAIDENGTDTWQCAVYYRGAHKSNPFITEEFLKDHPEREAILNGEKRFERESARALYPELDFLPSRQTGYAPCLCGRACDMACCRHLKEKNRL